MTFLTESIFCIAGVKHDVQGDEGVLVPQCCRPPHGTQDQENPGQPRC